MSRTQFETAADRARERMVAAALAREWRCTLRKSPPLAGYDYTCHRGGPPLAVVEIKSRLNRTPADFGGLAFINDEKRRALLCAAWPHQCAALFVWHFPGVLFWIDVGRLGGSPELRGRADRDGWDVRPVYRVRLADTARIGLPEG